MLALSPVSPASAGEGVARPSTVPPEVDAVVDAVVGAAVGAAESSERLPSAPVGAVVTAGEGAEVPIEVPADVGAPVTVIGAGVKSQVSNSQLNLVFQWEGEGNGGQINTRSADWQRFTYPCTRHPDEECSNVDARYQ